jgi:hypothetical protein
METKNEPKTSQKRAKMAKNEPKTSLPYPKSTLYTCKMCDYNTSKISNYKRHRKSKKHLKNTSGTFSHFFPPSKNKQILTIKKYICQCCMTEFSSKSSFYRHKKICNKLFEENKLLKIQLIENDKKNLENVNNILLNQNNQLKLLKTQHINMTNSNNVTNNQNTNNISINMFLNEKCKNAMNLKDFVNNIKLQLLDIKMGNNYVDCVSNILIKNLKDLTPTERPIHCTDQKRLQFYIKDGESWEKDINQLDKSIDNIHNKQYELLHTFDEKYKDNDIDFNERQKIANIVYEPSLKDKTNINEAIKRKVCDAVDIKNDLYIK